ncbi:MAG: hypothetical protein KDD64_15010 [Bdellovibrionales bacterium]|nr:hypothetical protein [Bdellovibrionales bacterium]
MKSLFAPPWSYLIPGVLIVFALTLFNGYYLRQNSLVQESYNTWLQEVERTASGVDPSDLLLSVELSSTIPSFSGRWELSANLTEADSERSFQIHRVLQLFRDAELFNKPETVERDEAISLAIQGPSRKFSLSFSKLQLQEDIQLQNLVRLIQIFSSPESVPSYKEKS